MNSETQDVTTVLFIWDVPERLKSYLKEGLIETKGLNLIFPEEATESEFLKHANDCDIIVGWRPTRELLWSAKKLSLFINPGVGVQHHIEPFRELRKERPVTLVNGHGNTYFTAQHAVALLLALTNKVIPHHIWMSEGKWRRGDDYGRSIPLRSRKIGLLGYGAINQKVHRFLSEFDVEFSILRRTWEGKHQDIPTKATKYSESELHSFLEEVDTVIIAVPVTEKTIGLIGKKELEILGPEGYVVNVARGEIIDEQSLYNALVEKKIAGAAIDVWYEYRPEPNADGLKFPYSFPFHELDNVVLSPHRGASPMNDLKRWDEVVENIQRFVSGRTDFLNIVYLERGY
ncbi:MAG: NAD(P)-dependent oxidoreductase [Candidatus Thorarchaeota archaeon]